MSEITLNSLPKTLDELKAMPQATVTRIEADKFRFTKPEE